MQELKSTVDNSLTWRLWHGLNYLIGGIFFFIGSFLLFPQFNHYLPAPLISAWLYTIGAFTFVIADIINWLHYITRDCHHLSYVLNYLLALISSIFYFAGSVCYIPQVEQSDLGTDLFIYGSVLVGVAQTWKLYNVNTKSGIRGFCDDISGMLVILLPGIGALIGYFIGCFYLQAVPANPSAIYPAASLFSFGGTLYLLSAVFMQKRYFFETKQPKDNSSPNEYQVYVQTDS